MKIVRRYLSNIIGFKTNRKIVVFESDDWGSTRMPSLESYYKLIREGVNLKDRDAERYNLNDSLATKSDLEHLYEVLSSFKDKYGKPAVFTANTLVSNPDFEKIKQSDYKEYHYEPFTITLKKFSGHEGAFDLWIEGIKNEIFHPQMHGREHLNVKIWLRALQLGDEHTLLAFNHGFWGFVPDQLKLPGFYYQSAFLLNDPEEIDYHRVVIKEGLDLFENLFGYRARYFVPPNGFFNNNLNKTLIENGIKYRSIAKIQREPLGNGKFKKSFHWLGQIGESGITYITRNCFFEPSQPGKDWINSCLKDVDIAFQMNKPAIISTHRVNYIGSLNLANRDTGLRSLKFLLHEITKKWPNVEFLTTDKLGSFITSEN